MAEVFALDRHPRLRVLLAPIGLALSMLWLSFGMRVVFLRQEHFAFPTFLFAFGLVSVLLSKTDLTAPEALRKRTVFAAPLLILLSSALLWMGTPLKAAAMAVAAMGSATLVCQWMSFCVVLSPYRFALTYALASLTTLAAGEFLFAGTGILRHVILLGTPFLSAGLLHLASGDDEPQPQARDDVSLLSVKTILYLFFFSFVLNGSELLTQVSLDRDPSLTLLKNGAYSLALAGTVLTLRARQGLSPRTFMGGALLLAAMGTLLLGPSPALGIVFLEAGCALFEVAFWLFMLDLATQSDHPSRIMCGGVALVAFALLSTHVLSTLFAPFLPTLLRENMRLFQTGLFFALSTLFLFLPHPTGEISATPEDPAAGRADREDAPPSLSIEEDELLIKGIFDAFGLTRQESKVAFLLLDGAGDDRICGELYISKNTLKYHIRNLIRKLNIPSRRELPPLVGRALAESRATVRTGETSDQPKEGTRS
ncbi:MAG TPA: hypothetical protein DIC53_04455 [Synergistaceae bacterium]|nr:hypothetical protein [Synergistaceae bacterium]